MGLEWIGVWGGDQGVGSFEIGACVVVVVGLNCVEKEDNGER